MTIEQIKEEIKALELSRREAEDRFHSERRSILKEISILEKKKLEIDPISCVFGLVEVYPRRTWYGSHVTIFYKGKGGYWAERDYINESDGFWSMDKRGSYDEMSREVARLDRQCKETIKTFITATDGEKISVKLAPMNTFKYNIDQCGVRLVDDELYENAPALRFRYWDGQDRLAKLSKEDYEYYKAMHEERSKYPSCTINRSQSFLREMGSKREKLRLLQMGQDVCSYYKNSNSRKWLTPTDKTIVTEYNKMQDPQKRGMRGHNWHMIEVLTEAYFERVGINPKTFDTKKAKESVVKSTARHLAKKLKKVKQLTTHELDFFKMMHGASLIKKLTEKGITV